MTKSDKETYGMTALLTALFIFSCFMIRDCDSTNNERMITQQCLIAGHSLKACGMEAK